MARPDPFADLVIASDSTIRDAMEAISANGREVVVVREAGGHIVGLITDGDIRRGLLRGLTLASPARDVMTRDFFSVAPDVNRATVLDFMMARVIRHVPVIDDERRLVAIHFLGDLIGASQKPNAAVIMAGGRGTRLRPLTDRVPKPMVEVAGRPILEHIVLHLVGHGVRHIYLAVNFMAEVIERYFKDGAGFGCRIEYLRETAPKGTGGALSLLPRRPEHPLLVLNGDQITRVDISGMLDAHAKSRCVATMGVGPHQIEVPYATITARDGRLSALEEKPTVNFLVNRGAYVLDAATLALVPGDREFPITALFESLLEARQPVGVFYFDDSWIDVGRPEDLRRAHGMS